MSTYKQLTQEQRYQIYALKKARHRQTEIANIVGVHKSTICRELRRNQGQRGYRPKEAQKFALARRQRRWVRIQPQIWKLVAQKLQSDWSPEQISGWMRRNGYEPVSHPVTNELGRDECTGSRSGVRTSLCDVQIPTQCNRHCPVPSIGRGAASQSACSPPRCETNWVGILATSSLHTYPVHSS